MARYGKLTDGKIAYAPRTLRVDGAVVCNPTPAQYAAQGWKVVLGGIVAPESPREGFHYEGDGWVEQRAAIVPKWKLVRDAKPSPRIFSKLKVVASLTEAGVWEQVKAWIEANGLYDLYLAAQEFAEDNKWFAQGLAALKPVVGWTDEQVEALLEKCVKE